MGLLVDCARSRYRAEEEVTSTGTWPRADTVPLGHYELSTHLHFLEVLRRGYQP